MKEVFLSLSHRCSLLIWKQLLERGFLFSRIRRLETDAATPPAIRSARRRPGTAFDFAGRRSPEEKRTTVHELFLPDLLESGAPVAGLVAQCNSLAAESSARSSRTTAIQQFDRSDEVWRPRICSLAVFRCGQTVASWLVGALKSSPGNNSIPLGYNCPTLMSQTLPLFLMAPGLRPS